MGRAPATKEIPLSSPKRRNAPSDSFKREKGRSRNACDRCKQKKVKCDGEGLQTCSICQEGDFHCNYAQKALSEKTQYRKGYVEMVEETNEYYKSGLHKLYELFQDEEVFAELRERYSRPGQQPTAQEIVRASGATSSNKVCEGGIEAIQEHLASEDRSFLVRHGEWDRVQALEQPLSPTNTASSSDSPLIRSAATLAVPEPHPAAAASPDPLETERTPTPAIPQASRLPYQPAAPAAIAAVSAAAAGQPVTQAVATAPSRRPPSVASTPQRGAYAHSNTFLRAGPGRGTIAAYPAGPATRYARPSLATGHSLRHAPYPSPASLSPVHPRSSSFGNASTGNSNNGAAAADSSFDSDYEPAQPTVCPADLELGGSCPPSRQPSLIDRDYGVLGDLQVATMLGGDSDVHMTGFDDFSAALAAATAAGVQGGSVDLSWFGIPQHFQPPMPQQHQQEGQVGPLHA